MKGQTFYFISELYDTRPFSFTHLSFLLSIYYPQMAIKAVEFRHRKRARLVERQHALGESIEAPAEDTSTASYVERIKVSL